PPRRPRARTCAARSPRAPGSSPGSSRSRAPHRWRSGAARSRDKPGNPAYRPSRAPTVAAGPDADGGADTVESPLVKVRLTPQRREFFQIYGSASVNAVEIARLLVELLNRFPDDGAELIPRVKEREHEGDRLTHEVIDLLNRTFVTPFDRDDMY